MKDFWKEIVFLRCKESFKVSILLAIHIFHGLNNCSVVAKMRFKYNLTLLFSFFKKKKKHGLTMQLRLA
jgi:hypothetical protein